MASGDETKICRIIDTYALDGLNEALRTRHGEGDSLRDLADFVNRRILDGALNRTEATIVTEGASLYDVLTDEDVSAGRRAEMETKLERAGVDVEEVRQDFVSHQTVKQHLNDQLGIDTSRESDLDVGDAISRMDWSQSRNEAVVRNTLEQLEALGELDACEYTVSSSMRISCTECGETYRLREFVERGGCACDEERMEHGD